MKKAVGVGVAQDGDRLLGRKPGTKSAVPVVAPTPPREYAAQLGGAPRHPTHLLPAVTGEEAHDDGPLRPGQHAPVPAGGLPPLELGCGVRVLLGHGVHGSHDRTGRLRDQTKRDTIVYMAVEPLRDVRNHFSEVIDRVEHEHERVTVTRNGRPVAVILSPEDLAELEETLTVLSDPEALADIREGDAAYAGGDVVRGSDAVRALRP